jgi:hypothetical protein
MYSELKPNLQSTRVVYVGFRASTQPTILLQSYNRFTNGCTLNLNPTYNLLGWFMLGFVPQPNLQSYYNPTIASQMDVL